MANYLIGAGSSFLQGCSKIQQAYFLISKNSNIKIVGESIIYANPPQGCRDYFLYNNAVFAIKTNLTPEALLLFLRSVEQKLGRMRAFINAPRSIDLDILWCKNLKRASKDLNIPLNNLFNRSFALIPAIEAAKKAKIKLELEFTQAFEKLNIESRFKTPDQNLL
ncbi:2-amino-4-hydroxy-6-hydroxymethyldihydropteridine diphosphokinase [Sulfobacillus acidophilus]|uniref:2-amino-4-hydroxy-6-hydroxymethyldihydropteridine diphosphokinase n=1 Tax=Sulfobacillus acidophilus TaxID=53633 RepID=A0ABS3AVN5_9FIRM|nr:2-amino-4-hydroxy-6-hydroxymethyldihydropteridine diphosphokinase [Sulfobacillus acidophilus]